MIGFYVTLSSAVQPSLSEGRTAGHIFGREPVAQLEPNFDGIVIGWSSSKIVSGSRALPPRWLPQCSCVVIENSFDPGERLQAPGSLWFYYFLIRKSWMGEYQRVKFWFSYIKVSIIIPLSLEVVRIEYISMRHQSNVILMIKE